MNTSTSDHRFNFERSPKSSTSTEDTNEDTNEASTDGKSSPKSFVQDINEGQDHSDLGAGPSNPDHSILDTTSLEDVTPSPPSRKRLRRSLSEYLDPVASTSRLRLELSLPSAKRFKHDENDSESVGSLLTSPPSPTSSDGIEDSLPNLSQSQLSDSTGIATPSIATSSREEPISRDTPKFTIEKDSDLDVKPRNTSAKSPGRANTTSADVASPPSKPPLGNYTCPICFSAPTNATMTPCGHICCGECLFTAVKTTIQRAAYHGPEAERAKCPVCRAPIPGWDGRGGGVIGLQPRVAYKPESSKTLR
ncbi:hypothetical protein QCA50_006290 [Cerrena zonata]|uniref:RING-type domain-containing protein n=1 Tax=Cerrena zonata TaxID=2478898 RepID=A0AAW0GHD7_9APHY